MTDWLTELQADAEAEPIIGNSELLHEWMERELGIPGDFEPPSDTIPPTLKRGTR